MWGRAPPPTSGPSPSTSSFLTLIRSMWETGIFHVILQKVKTPPILPGWCTACYQCLGNPFFSITSDPGALNRFSGEEIEKARITPNSFLGQTFMDPSGSVLHLCSGEANCLWIQLSSVNSILICYLFCCPALQSVAMWQTSFRNLWQWMITNGTMTSTR